MNVSTSDSVAPNLRMKSTVACTLSDTVGEGGSRTHGFCHFDLATQSCHTPDHCCDYAPARLTGTHLLICATMPVLSREWVRANENVQFNLQAHIR